MRRIPFSPRLFVFNVLFASFFFLFALLSLSPAVCFAQASEEVTLAWDANSEDNLAGYKLYYKLDTSGAPYDGTGLTEGDSPVIIYLDELDDSTDPTFTLTGLEEDQLYYFALTAFDTDDLESDYSDEVSYETSASDLDSYIITASASGQGSISPEGSVSVTEGSSQTFSFVADSNYHLADVVVDDVSMGDVSAYSFENVSASHTIEAVFEADTFTVTASAGSGGSISPAGETTASYGESVSYVITSAEGYHISDVTVDGESVGEVAAYSFENISASHTIAATFAVDTFTLTATAGTGGTISPSGATSATYGESVSYTISASTGYHISNVTVDGDSVGLVTAYTFEDISDSHTIAATFAADTFTLTATAGTGGTISPSGTTSATYGDSVSYTISASTGYHVSDVTVDGESVGQVSSYTFDAISATHTIAATFAADTFTLTATAGTGGTISPSGTTSATYGDSVSYTISASTGYHVSDVTVDGESVGQVSSYTFDAISASHTIAATFEADTFTLTATAGTGGTISPSGATSATYGDSVSYTISASTGYHVSDVTVDGESVGQVSSYTFDAISASHTIAATFAVDTYTITASAGTGGTISPTGDTTVASGESLTCTIAPDDNYHILDVTVDGVSVGQVTSYTFESVSAVHTIVASFEIDTYTVTATAGENGTITPSGVESVAYGDNLTFTIVPDANYHVLDVTVDGVSVGQVTSYTFDTITASHSIVASFEVDTYTVTAVSGDNGAITPSGVESVAYGSSLTYTISADENYHVSDVMVDSTSVGSITSYTFDTITASHTIEAVFEIDTFTIVASVSGSGSITPEGTVELDYGASQVFAIAPDDGQTIEAVTVDGESVGAVEEYLFENIDGNHTIEAVFVESEPVFAMEVGSIAMTGDSQQVSFENTFTDPVVVASTLTTENADSVVVRISNVTATGFEISAESWTETDESGVQDTIGYVVMEAGSFSLPDGTVAEAEIIVSEDTTSFSGVDFLGSFSQIPAAGATITSNNDPASVKAVLQNITTTGFEYKLQEQVADDDGRLSEMVSYIALEDHETPLGDEMVAAGLSEEMLTFAHEVLSLSQPSANGVDTGSTDEDTGDTEEDTGTVDDGAGDTEEDSGSTDDGSTGSETDDDVTDDGTADDGGESGDDSTGSETDSEADETGNHAPGAPVPVSSETPETGIGPVGLVVADQFADPDTGDVHAKTEWQVIQLDSGLCVLDTVSSTALTECSVPEIMLTASTTYTWRARFYDNNGAASEWSETAGFETGASATDLDEDGVPDDQEADASVDVNHDGISDVDQEDILSIVLPSSHQPIGLSVEDEASEVEILSMEAIAAESLPVPEVTRRRVKRLPHGLINFKLAVAEPGDAVTVTVYFDRPAHDRARWMKLDLINDVWIDYSGYAQFSDDRMSVSIELVDGGFGDDDGVANGIIVDPAGIEVAAAEDDEATSTTTTDESADEKTTAANSANGCFITGVAGEKATGLWLMGILMILGAAMVRLVRRNE